MKKTIALGGAAAVLFAATFRIHAGILAGPITNPANGHAYYLLSPNTWAGAEAEAENMGGTLATIRNAAEQEWVFSKFGREGGSTRNLWIGLRQQYPGGPFAWASGEPVNFMYWDAGQPDNSGGADDCAYFWATDTPQNFGKWDDTSGSDQKNGVAEISGKADEKSLSAKEKLLVGTWYDAGRPDQPCYIAATADRLFAIDHSRNASRLIITPDGFLFAANSHEHGNLTGDKIVWSNGTWWSRKPVKYSKDEKPEAADK